MSKKPKTTFQKIWYFIWEDNSIWSWIVNIVLAFVLIKFIVYPGLGFLLATSHPVVAVVSESMEHNAHLDEWWESNKQWYEAHGITKGDFQSFSLKNGFNKGDIMVLLGRDAEHIALGDVIVFSSAREDPIIHRVVAINQAEGAYFFQTKGDNNRDSIKTALLDETNISEDRVIGKAVVRIPLLGYIKIGFVALIEAIR